MSKLSEWDEFSHGFVWVPLGKCETKGEYDRDLIRSVFL